MRYGIQVQQNALVSESYTPTNALLYTIKY